MYQMKVGVVNCSSTYNLACNKIANYHRDLGDEVVTSNQYNPLFMSDASKVYFSIIFTWELPKAISMINQAKTNSDVEIGGPASTFMHNWVNTNTGIEPHIGLDSRFEFAGGKYKVTFTSRGCPHNCLFCGVRRVEPVAIEYALPKCVKCGSQEVEVSGNELKCQKCGARVTREGTYPIAPMLSDNNILATSFAHQYELVNRLSCLNSTIDINSGFDCRFFVEEHYNLYSKLKLRFWRLAFDTMAVESDFERVMKLLTSKGHSRHDILVYVLAGFNDTPEEVHYRARKVISLKGAPYIMRFWPLNSLDRTYVDKSWISSEGSKSEADKLLRKLVAYYNHPEFWTSVSWDKFNPRFKPEPLNPQQPMLTFPSG